MKQNKNVGQSNETSNKVKKFFSNDIVKVVVAELIVLLVVGFAASAAGVLALPARFTEIEKNMKELNESVTAINELNLDNRFSNIEKDISGLEDRIARIEYGLMSNDFVKLEPMQSTIESMSIEYMSANNAYYLKAPTWISVEIIAKDAESGQEYRASELAGEKLLLPYVSNGQEVYFYGQFNKNNQWDGNCLINIYKNDNLVLIMEAEYKDGTLIQYRQVIPSVTQAGKNVWVISERESNGDTNSGESWNYIRNDECVKDFDFDSVGGGDMISVEAFKSTINTPAEAYYSGDTSDGMYNDDTGQAYLVKYAEDGTVRTLYVGQFKNGQFHDNTGEAWYITRDDDTEYMYYRGVFKNGAPANNKGNNFENELSIERVNEIINGISFGCDLNWYDTEIE